jgi:phosphatidylglycerol:prolipoprotein diacylglycerol transferase
MLPFIEVFGEKIPTYLVIISFTYCFALVYLLRRAKSKAIDEKIVLDSALVLMVSGFLGSRLFHVFYEQPKFYMENPLHIFYIWQGGFVFFGGAILAFFCTRFFIHKKEQNWPAFLDLYAPVVILSYAIGRLSCLAAGCCYGSSCDLPWAISNYHGELIHPTPAYASLWALGNWAILNFLDRNSSLIRKSGDLFYIGLCIHSIGRVIMEVFRADHRGLSLGPISISMLISFFLFFWGLKKYKKKE